jgi:hypothetical protein
VAVAVHLVGGDPWWHQVIGPTLIALTAIVAAWIAAGTANRRQQQQLLHDRDLHQAQLSYDRDRQEAQLAHDRDLQKAQLAYDREQRNRQHVRDAIDAVVAGHYRAMRQLAEYQGAILTGDENRERYRRTIEDETLPEPERDAAVRDYEDAMKTITETTIKGFEISTELMSDSLRLDLRLGVEHPICKSHTAYVDAYGAAFKILQSLPTVKMTEEDHKKVKEADAVETAAVVGFLSSCRSWFEDEQRRVEQEPNAQTGLTSSDLV